MVRCPVTTPDQVRDREVRLLELVCKFVREEQDDGLPVTKETLSAAVTSYQAAVATAEGTPGETPKRPGRALTRRPRLGVPVQQIVQELVTTFGDVGSEARKRLTAAEDRHAKARMLFAYWAMKCHHEQSLEDPKRIRFAEDRLVENGGNISEGFYVIDGASGDRATMGQRDGVERFDRFEVLFRDRAHVERYAELCPGYRRDVPHPMAVKWGLDGETRFGDPGGLQIEAGL